jgi:hypothetical protein
MNRAKPSSIAACDEDRRSACRYAVVQNHAWLGWWEGKEFRHIPVVISDISLRGAMLTVEKLPTTPSVWFCPPSLSLSAPKVWLEARVIEVRKRLMGPRRMRIIFRKSFPYEIFKAVVYGPEAVGGAQPQSWIPEVLDENCDNLW